MGNTPQPYLYIRGVVKCVRTQGERMVTQLILDLEPCISLPRLQRYRSPGATDDLNTIVNYLWNMAINESLYCSLNAVEISLRNTLHDTLSGHFGTPNWYDRKGLLDPEQLRQVRKAQGNIKGYGRPVTPGRVVGELNFGFWVTILSRNYDARLWQGARAAPLKQAFPRVSRKMRQRVTIHNRYNTIRKLRNRVFHHEPLFDDLNLLRHHQTIYYAIHWINPEMSKTTALVDRFPHVYTNGRAEIEAKIKEHVGIL